MLASRMVGQEAATIIADFKGQCMSRVYPNSSKQKKFRGKAIIALFSEFHPDAKMPSIEQAKLDVKNIENSLIQQRFEVETMDTHEDMTKENFLAKLQEVTKPGKHAEAECFVMVIITHGEKDGILHAYDAPFYVKDVWNNFTADNCEELKGKPKMFFIHACCGNELSLGVYASGNMHIPQKDPVLTYTIPVEADLFIMFSTFQGKVAFAPICGSPFILYLCLVLEEDLSKSEDQKEHILELATYIGKLTGLCEFWPCFKQQPTIVSTLTRLYYFK